MDLAQRKVFVVSLVSSTRRSPLSESAGRPADPLAFPRYCLLATRRTRRARSDSAELDASAPASLSSTSSSSALSKVKPASQKANKQAREKKQRTKANRDDKATAKATVPSTSTPTFPEVLSAVDVVSAGIPSLSVPAPQVSTVKTCASLSARRQPRLRLEVNLPSMAVLPSPAWAAGLYGASSAHHVPQFDYHGDDDDDIHALRTPALSEAGDDDLDPFDALDFDLDAQTNAGLFFVNSSPHCSVSTVTGPVDSDLSYSPRTPTDQDSAHGRDLVRDDSWVTCESFGQDYFSNAAGLLSEQSCGGEAPISSGVKDLSDSQRWRASSQQTWATLLDHPEMDRGWTTPEWYASGLSF